MALLLVMLMLSITLALSYAAVRTQHETLRVQSNGERRQSARQLAFTGLSMGIKRMQTAEWEGADAAFTMQLAPFESFHVTYTTGDPRLGAGDPDYDDFPWRVTVVAEGYAADPDYPQSIATHRVQAVLRLVPRQMPAEPTGWTTATEHTVFQRAMGEFELDNPMQIIGTIRAQGFLGLAMENGWSSSVASLYYEHLKAMLDNGSPDNRPLTGRVSLPTASQSPTVLTLLNKLGVPVSNLGTSEMSGATYPSALCTYRLYTKGKAYTIPTVSSTVNNCSLGPNPLTNPLGLYACTSTTRLADDLNFCGSLISLNDEVKVDGNNVQLRPVSLPSLYGTDEPVQIPVLLSGSDLNVLPGSSAQIEGLVVCGDRFDIDPDEQYDISFTLKGRLIARNIDIQERVDWYHDAGWWDLQRDSFQWQQYSPTGIRWFPEWLRVYRGLDYRPRIKLSPPATAVRYHWHNPDQPVFVPHPSDGGLRFELLDWSEIP
ncbi:MAG: hypothetical protein ACOY3P_01355 [Planctomycetota bacterium]